MTRIVRATVVAHALGLLCAGGCAGVLGGGSPAGATGWDGPDCGRVLYDLDATSDVGQELPVAADPSIEAQVLLQVCPRRHKTTYYGGDVEQAARVAAARPTDLYLAWDDTAPSPVQDVALAAAAIEIAARRLDYQTRTDVGLALFIRAVVPVETVEHAVGSVALPDGARAAFVARYREVPARLLGSLSPDERRVAVDVPAAVFRARAAHIATYRALYERLVALRWDAAAARDDATVLAPTIAGLRALRGEFVAACGAIECRYQPLYAIATRELAQLHALAGELLPARIESRLIVDDGSYLGGLAQAVRSAQRTAVDAMTAAWDRYDRAIDSGADDGAARRLAGPFLPAARPDELAHDVVIDVALAVADVSQAIDPSPNQQYTSNGYVERVRGSGATRTIVFRPSEWELDEHGYSCASGDRLIRVEADGSLAYDRSCRWRTRTIGAGHDPITVPADEAAGIRRGDLVVFMTHDDDSLVLEVRRGDDTIQLRGDQLRRK